MKRKKKADDREKALGFLEEALARRERAPPFINADAVFDELRDEKRFVEIIRRIGLPPGPNS